MPWGFMLSAVAAREEAERNDFVVKAGLDAALRAFRANIVIARLGWCKVRWVESLVGDEQQLLLESSASRRITSSHRPNSARLAD